MIWLTRITLAIAIAANLQVALQGHLPWLIVNGLAALVLGLGWFMIEHRWLRGRRVDETTKLTLQQLPHLSESVVWLTLYTAPLRDINEIQHYLRTHKIAQVPTDDMPELIVTFLLLVAYAHDK